MEKIIVRLDTKGSAIPGIDRSLLDEDITAELEKYSEKVKGTLTRVEKPAPEGSQGEGVIEWFIENLQDPDMAKVYAGIFVYALNRILTAINQKQSKGKEGSESGDKKSSLVEVTLFNKAILLPAASVLIKEFLESIGR